MAVKVFTGIVLVFQIISSTMTSGEQIASSSVGEKQAQVFLEDSVKRADIRQKRSDDNGALETVLMQQAQRLTSLEATIQTMTSHLDSLSNTKGSTFVRWGKSHCPNGSITIYSGYGGCGNYKDSGTGANRLCMTSYPAYDDMAVASGGHGTVYGAQYFFNGRTSYTDVLCSLCHTSFSATFMVPGTNRCPDGTTEQYHGYLSVGNYGSTSASEYLCLDSNPDDRPGTTANHDCAWFDHTVTACGSLPCPPYVSGKVVTCAVCSR